MCRMLIVDDERVILDSLYGYLSEQFDFEIYRAESARQALEVLRRMSVDLVISDISMPKMDGLELLGVIASTWPACRVMLFTAYNDFNYAYQAMRHPHVRYLLKIESYEEIRRNVQEMADEIEEERRNNQLMLTMDRRLHQTAYAVCNYVTGRMVAQGVPLPKQQELDALQIPLRLPVLLALGQVEIMAEEARGRAGASIGLGGPHGGRIHRKALWRGFDADRFGGAGELQSVLSLALLQGIHRSKRHGASERGTYRRGA